MNQNTISTKICQQGCGSCQIPVTSRQINSLPIQMFFRNMYCLILSILDCQYQFDKQESRINQAINTGIVNIPDLSTITISCSGLISIIFINVKFNLTNEVQTVDAIKNRTVLELLRCISLYTRNNYGMINDNNLKILADDLLNINLIKFDSANIRIVLDIIRQLQS